VTGPVIARPDEQPARVAADGASFFYRRHRSEIVG
jgi:hypothetical protein